MVITAQRGVTGEWLVFDTIAEYIACRRDPPYFSTNAERPALLRDHSTSGGVGLQTV
jgi:hypothetical protein